jgi:hypothetical protein
MAQPMPKILLALLTLATLTGAASPQSRTFYDASGKIVGRSSTDSQGTVTTYDARGGDRPRVHQRQRDHDDL